MAETVARELFAPLGPTYDRYANAPLLRAGPALAPLPRLARRTRAGTRPCSTSRPGTAAVAIELVRRNGCRVVGVDRSPEMLAAGRARVERAGLADRIELREGRAEALPFDDASFDALTFTYLLRYVDDPAATLRELARVVRPGGTVAALEFGVPPAPVWRRALGAVGAGRPPGAGRIVSPGWHEVGRFLGPSIRGFYERHPLRDSAALERGGHRGRPWRSLSLGGGVVTWGRRA